MFEDQSPLRNEQNSAQSSSDLDVLLDQQKLLDQEETPFTVKKKRQAKIAKTGNEATKFVIFLGLVLILILVLIYYFGSRRQNSAAVSQNVPLLGPTMTTFDLAEILVPETEPIKEPTATSASGVQLKLSEVALTEPVSISPTQTYVNFKKAINEVSTLEDFLDVSKEYVNGSSRKNLIGLEMSLGALSSEVKNQTLAQLLDTTPALADLKTVQETTTGDSSTLIVTTKNGSEGTIEMVREAGEWKIAKENWALANE
ncbi:MAG: LPXTG cell wall anchor domain-containing protein [bacterium]|nr:LPXTG cell wall anchor domain-containing protein [bacterium]